MALVVWPMSCRCISDKNRNAYGRFFPFSEVAKTFQLLHLLQFCSLVICKFMPKIIRVCQKWVIDKSWSKEWVRLECHECFNVGCCHHQQTDTLYTSTHPTKNANTRSKIFLFSLPFISVKFTVYKVVNCVQLFWRGWWPHSCWDICDIWFWPLFF